MKLLSARFWMAILFSATTCAGFMQEKISGELFAGLVIVVVNFYFVRQRTQ